MMPFQRLPLVSLLTAVLACLSACENTSLPVAQQGMPAPVGAELKSMPVQPLDPALLRPPETSFRLGPGDVLEIEEMGDLATQATVVVGPDGRIYYNILPGIDVWGLTLHEASGRLGDELGKYVREKPVVTLVLRSVVSQQVWVLGRLGKPGVYALGGPTSLLDAFAEAGGLGVNNPAGGSYSEAADLSRSFLVRDGHLVPVDFQRLLGDGDISQNVYLWPNDFIFVPSLRSAEIHILGAVLQPRSERTGGSLTLVQAIALAGGTVPGACLSNVAILRGSLVHPQIAIVAVNQVLHGKAPDVRLEPGDIVYVPYVPERVLLRYVNLILDTFVRTVGVNEGAYTINSKAQPISVGVNLSP
jgi:protein involved in polysaccharide export with SLBB domain